MLRRFPCGWLEAVRVRWHTQGSRKLGCRSRAPSISVILPPPPRTKAAQQRAHSKTLARSIKPFSLREVLDCGGAPPLSLWLARSSTCAPVYPRLSPTRVPLSHPLHLRYPTATSTHESGAAALALQDAGAFNKAFLTPASAPATTDKTPGCCRSPSTNHGRRLGRWSASVSCCPVVSTVRSSALIR